MTFEKWIKQPSTITGIGVACATIAGLIAHVLSGQTSIALAVAGGVGAVVHVVMPDNSAVERPVERFVADAIEAGVTKRWQAEAPKILKDGAAVFEAVAAPAPAQPQETKK